MKKTPKVVMCIQKGQTITGTVEIDNQQIKVGPIQVEDGMKAKDKEQKMIEAAQKEMNHEV